MLGSDPSFFLLNITQTPINTFPSIGGRYTATGIAKVAEHQLRKLAITEERMRAAGLKKLGRDASAVEARAAKLEEANSEMDELFRAAGVTTQLPIQQIDILAHRVHSPGMQNLVSGLNFLGGGSENLNRMVAAAGTYSKYMDAAADIEKELRLGTDPTHFIRRWFPKYKSLDGYNDEATAFDRVLRNVKAGSHQKDALEAAFENTQFSQFSYRKASGSILTQQSQLASLQMLYRSYFFKTLGSFLPKLDAAQRAQWVAMHAVLAGPAAVPFVQWMASSSPAWQAELEGWSVNGISAETAKRGRLSTRK